jgi:hypothetical protein
MISHMTTLIDVDAALLAHRVHKAQEEHREILVPRDLQVIMGPLVHQETVGLLAQLVLPA